MYQVIYLWRQSVVFHSIYNQGYNYLVKYHTQRAKAGRKIRHLVTTSSGLIFADISRTLGLASKCCLQIFVIVRTTDLV